MSLQICKEDYERRFPGDAYAPIGATEEEVRAVEERMGLAFPKEYRDFLLWMGNDHDGLLRDGDWYLDDVERLTESLGPWLEDNGIAPPEGKYVCCYSWQGYVYGWFLLTPERDDPRVYLFNECDKARPKPYPVGRFTGWLEDIMEGSRVDIWKQFYARQEYDAAQAAKNGGLNPDGTVYKPRIPPWDEGLDEIRKQIREAESKDESAP